MLSVAPSLLLPIGGPWWLGLHAALAVAIWAGHAALYPNAHDEAVVLALGWGAAYAGCGALPLLTGEPPNPSLAVLFPILAGAVAWIAGSVLSAVAPRAPRVTTRATARGRSVLPQSELRRGVLHAVLGPMAGEAERAPKPFETVVDAPGTVVDPVLGEEVERRVRVVLRVEEASPDRLVAAFDAPQHRLDLRLDLQFAAHGPGSSLRLLMRTRGDPWGAVVRVRLADAARDLVRALLDDAEDRPSPAIVAVPKDAFLGWHVPGPVADPPGGGPRRGPWG